MYEPWLATMALAAALLASLAGMVWLALSMPVHARQVWDATPSTTARRAFKAQGVIAQTLALLLCLQVDHASMAVLVWVMAAAAAALCTAFTLAWQPRWLRLFAPWQRKMRSGNLQARN